MPKHKTIQRVEDASALAITARQRLTALAQMLESLHQRGGLSDYNIETARQDISEAVAIIRRLQDEICTFRGKQ
jgi:two-component sensor histidine kinase